MSMMPPARCQSPLTEPDAEGVQVHVNARHLPHLPAGPFARLPSGRLFSAAGNPAQGYVSDDNGATWRSFSLASDGMEPAHTGALLASASGTLILAFPNVARKHWDWDNTLKDAPRAFLPTCVMRSTDGERWQDHQSLHDDWTGATRCMLQTASGRLVFTSMQMRHHPGRHTVLTYCSDDDGRTWRSSNVIDLGGNGHHDGTTEGTIVELKDGTLYQLIRTNWGGFWRALSHDGGMSWHPYGPAGIPASSAPAQLRRLASGRIVLLWNRYLPQDNSAVELRGGDGLWSAYPTSNFREELSMSFSADECASWTPPVVIARKAGSEVSYPYVFEPEPGTLWIAAHRWNLRMGLKEADFTA